MTAKFKTTKYLTVHVPVGCAEPDPQPGFLYIEYPPDEPVRPDRALLLCPCGCGSHYYLSLDPRLTNEPTWTLTLSGERGEISTLLPYVRNTGGCKSRFSITEGKVK